LEDFVVAVSNQILLITLEMMFYRMLSVTAPADQEVPMFTGTFVIVWCGAIVITINAKLLGGSM